MSVIRSGLHRSTLSALWSHFDADRGPALAALLCKEARRGVPRLLESFGDHPLGDDWRDFALKSVQAWVTDRQGIVYVVANPMHLGFYKVGQTGASLAERLQTLNSAGVVGQFVEVHQAAVPDRFAVEAAVHRSLTETVPRHKEFFQCTAYQAIAAVELHASQERQAVAGLLGACGNAQ